MRGRTLAGRRDDEPNEAAKKAKLKMMLVQAYAEHAAAFGFSNAASIVASQSGQRVS